MTVEGTQVTGGADKEKAPDSVPFHQYVGVKEMLSKQEARAADLESKLTEVQKLVDLKGAEVLKKETEVSDLVEQIKSIKNSTVDPTELKKAKDELAKIQGEILVAKRTGIAKKYGLAEDVVKDLGESQLDVFVKGIETVRGGQEKKAELRKPGADLGTGGSSNTPLSPIEQAKEELRIAREQRMRMMRGDSDYTK